MRVYREVKQDVYDKRQTVRSCVSQKHENLRFSTCLTLLRSYSIYLGNTQERSLNKSSFSVFWHEENFILPFAANVVLNLSYNSPASSQGIGSCQQAWLPSSRQQRSSVIFRNRSVCSFCHRLLSSSFSVLILDSA